MRLKTMLDRGAVFTKKLEWYEDRPKVSGRMWGGGCQVKLNGVTVNFMLWHHGGDTMDRKEAIAGMSIKGIRLEGEKKCYDIHWYTVMSEDEIWLHREGWFGFDVRAEQLKEEIDPMRANYNYARDKTLDTEKLKKLGFIKVL